MPFDSDTTKTLFKKCARAVDWIVEEVILRKDWRSLRVLLESPLVLLDFILFFALNPSEKPFPNLLSLFPQLKQFGWYAAVFWALVVAIFIIAVIVATPADRKTAEPVGLKRGAIKGLEPFGYEDAEIFSHLQRDQPLKECLQAIGDDQWRFGALSGESGAGKTSFLQAGLWPELEKRGLRCVYVKFSDADPFESVKRACLKHLSFADGAQDGVDFQVLLHAATAQDRTPIVLFFDQFEQFFVHRKRKKDRESFTNALARWFAETQSPPIKILICVRSDFLDRLNELQKAMRYSLGPAQSFRLERFEPDQATEIFCFLAEKEGLEYDRDFVSDMARRELADAEEGLISPVDIQILARMIEMQPAQGPRAFNRETLQKVGGARILLELYLVTALEPLITRSSRRAAISVLSALINLERDARAGALTFEDLRQKLGGDLSDSKLKDVVECLLRKDLPLISPSPENEEEKFELAHERLIPDLRLLEGKQLGEALYADQLLDHFTNLWLGNRRASRYLFSWSQLRVINKHRRSVVWGGERQAKEELLAASRRRFRLRVAAVGMMVLLFLSVQVGWRSNAWQTHLIKMYLYSQGFRLNDAEAMTDIAEALTCAGDSQSALQVLDRIGANHSKADALKRLAETYAQIGDKEKSGALLSDMIKMVERMDDGGKVYALEFITESYIKLGDKEKAESLLPERIKAVERLNHSQDKAGFLIPIARTYARLGDKEKALALLEDAIRAARRISNSPNKAFTLSEIARSYAGLEETMKDGAILEEAIKIAGRMRINDGHFRSDIVNEVVQSYTRLGEPIKDGAMLKNAIKISERTGSDRFNYYHFGEIVRSYARLGDKDKARALLVDAIKMAERINRRDKTFALRAIASSYAELGERVKAAALLEEAIKTADRINNDTSKSDILRAIARSYAEIGETMKAAALLEEVIKIADRISVHYYDYKAYALSETAESYARLGDKKKARALLEEAINKAAWIDSQNKPSALSAIVMTYARLAESSNDSALLYEVARRLIKRPQPDFERDQVLDAILSSKLAVADVERLRLLVVYYDGEVEKTRAMARILMACSHPELIKKNARAAPPARNRFPRR
jgi:tetratricopeptide (TPR) repeat protein